jgi:DNA-directed RNA polymerase specialized sigma24 family protein
MDDPPIGTPEDPRLEHDGHAQLQEDHNLVEALRMCDFQGPRWDRVADEWFRYGYPIVASRVWTSQIFDDCRSLGIPFPKSPAFNHLWSHEDVHDLAVEIVARALKRFRELLREGGWSKDRGAVLTTFFIGQCVLQFPNVYRAWQAEQRRWVSGESLDALGAFDNGQRELADSGLESDPCHRAELRMELTGLFRGVPDDVRQMVLLQSYGYSYKEIAEQLGVSRNDVSNGLARFKQRARRQPGALEEQEEGQ